VILYEPLQITQFVAEAFEHLQIPYLVGGSVASSLHGIPRATQDVDLVADIKSEHIQRIVKALNGDFYVSENAIAEAITHRSSFNIIHLATMLKVDIFILGDDSTSQEEMARREKYRVLEEPLTELYLASAEDIILHKLHWFQFGRGISERQWNDVIGVLQVKNQDLDFFYLVRQAKELGVSRLLEQAIEAAQLESH
jgi:hypothetical protein